MFGSTFSKYVIETAESWPLLLVMTAIAFIFTVIYFELLQFITKPIIFGSIFLILASGTIFTVLVGYRASFYLYGSKEYVETIAASVALGLGTFIFLVVICC